MKKSTSKTGNQYQDWCVGVLQELYPGCSIHNQKAVAKFIPTLGRWISQRNDIFGCIDIICLSPIDKPLFIQCTAHKSFTEKMKELVKVSWNLYYADVEIWMKRGPGRTEIRRLRKVNGEWALQEIGEIIRRKLVLKLG